MSIHKFMHMPVRVLVYKSIHVSVHMSAHMSMQMSVRLPIHMPAHMTIHMPMHMPTRMFIHVSIHMHQQYLIAEACHQCGFCTDRQIVEFASVHTQMCGHKTGYVHEHVCADTQTRVPACVQACVRACRWLAPSCTESICRGHPDLRIPLDICNNSVIGLCP